MIPAAPALVVRPLEADDLAAALAIVNHWLSASSYSLPMDRPAAYDLLLRDLLTPHYEVRLTTRCRLGVWRAGELLGFADIAAGHDCDHLDEPEHQPHGLLRFLALTDREPLAEEAFALLMQGAEQFWHNEKVETLAAYHISTGYPHFQAGAGILPGEWARQVRLLTATGWRFSQRYYLLARTSGAPIEEECPHADLSLVQQRITDGRIYRIYHRRVERVASARVMGMNLDKTGTAERVAHVVDLEVDELWRNRNLGRWLLRRILNDAALQGFQEVIAFLPMSRPIAMNLFIQQGFHEINYRGYTFEKTLAPQPAS
jgi:ribosomal protein S18 acetylase RimI-like enzyme